MTGPGAVLDERGALVDGRPEDRGVVTDGDGAGPVEDRRALLLHAAAAETSTTASAARADRDAGRGTGRDLR